MTRQDGHTRAHLRAADMMTAPIITVRPDTAVKDLAALMAAHHISGLPVVTPDSELVGIVTEADLLHKEVGPSRQDERHFGGLPAFGQAAAATRKAMGQVARDVMTSPVVTVEERTSLHEAAGLMVPVED